MKWLKDVYRNYFPRISEHIEKQKHNIGPWYCGTPFCGHRSARDAELCWQRHCVAVAELQEVMKHGDSAEVERLYSQVWGAWDATI